MKRTWKAKRIAVALTAGLVLGSLAGCGGDGPDWSGFKEGNGGDAAGKLAELLPESTRMAWEQIGRLLGGGGGSNVSRHNKAEVLKGYDKIAGETDRILEKYGEFTEESAEEAANEIYEYGQKLKKKGKISECIFNEDASSVTMVLETGANLLFAPHIQDTYSGSYCVDTVNAVDFGDTVPVSVLTNGGKSVRDYGEYTRETMAQCRDWNHLDDTEVSVSGVRDMLEDVAEDDCRLIYWRGHGNISDGKSVLMLAEEVNDETTNAFQEDIRDGSLIVGDTNYWITPEFVDKYMEETEDGGLFFCGACYSAADGGKLAKVFLDKGFQAYAGTSNTIYNIYSDWIMKCVAENLCRDDTKSPGESQTIRQALLAAKAEKGEADVAGSTFRLYERIGEAQQSERNPLLETVSWMRTDNIPLVEWQALNQTRTVPEFRLKELEIQNNGGTVVQYQGNAYYWKYAAGSVEDSGLFAYFPKKTNVPNQMICRHPDGTEEVLFSMEGDGEIYIAGNRMYLKGNTLYSVNLDGSDRRDYGYLEIWDADAASGTVWASTYENGGSVQVINSQDGSLRPIASGSYTYGDTIDGYVYYSMQDTARNELVLYQAPLDGSGSVRETDRFSLPSDYGMYSMGNTYVTQLSHLGNTLYYSYGYYAGTGGFFQGGGINRVELDAQGAALSRQACVDSIIAEEFLVEQKDGEVLVYYEGGDENGIGSYIGFWDDYAYTNSMVKNLNTNEVKQSDFRLSRPGSFVYLDGTISMQEENAAAYRTILTAEQTAAFGCGEVTGEESSVALIRDLNVIGNQVYFSVEKSTRDRGRDMGWRPGYQRVSTECYVMRLGEPEGTRLYSY
ncbi:MAG: hypothetical protein Q4F29_08680 [Lachnospiraceae bacterium]|nr:hypothetical protein [Lachnospiraceae bacterium]